jgi:hypothetical protein
MRLRLHRCFLRVIHCIASASVAGTGWLRDRLSGGLDRSRDIISCCFSCTVARVWCLLRLLSCGCVACTRVGGSGGGGAVPCNEHQTRPLVRSAVCVWRVQRTAGCHSVTKEAEGDEGVPDTSSAVRTKVSEM